MELESVNGQAKIVQEIKCENKQLRIENIKMRTQLMAYSRKFHEIHVAFYGLHKEAKEAFEQFDTVMPLPNGRYEEISDFGE